MKLRKCIVMITAVAIPISLISVFDVGAASAKGSPVAQPGKVTCSKIKGKITFNPPLTLNGTATENTTVKITVKGCSVSGGTVKPKKGTVSKDISTASSTNSCSSLGNSQPETLTVNWAPSSKIAPTTASFSGYAVATNGAGDEGFSLPDSGGTGSAAGSYAQASGVTATAFSNETSNQLALACSSPGGLASLKITSGSIG
ncbi:MAG TPA: hypothetical protein VNC61_09200 [Acidimicrobiales bacterium]|nr:hypothetical protein [Acidimicrobiales bacterium]